MFSLAMQTLRDRIGAFVGAFVALLCAAAIVTACGMLLDTGLRGEIPAERYAGASVVVGGDQQVHWTKEKKGKTKTKSKALTERAWIPAQLADTVAAVPGVSGVLSEVTFPAYVLDDRGVPIDGPDDGPSWGHGIESAPLTPFGVVDGAAPAAPGEIALDTELAGRAGMAVGDTVSVQATGAPASYTVVGLVTATGGALTQQSTVFFATNEARELSGHPGQVTALGVTGADTDALRTDLAAALTGTNAKVYGGKELGALEFIDADGARLKLISMGGAIGAMALLVGILVVVGTFALSMQQRHREIALLRAVAATPRQVRQLIGREALFVGLIAAPLGAFAGLGLAGWLRSRFVEYGVMPTSLDLVVSPFPMIAAVLATLGAAYLAARISARHVIRIRPTEALSESALTPPRIGVVRLAVGVLALAGGIVLLVVLSGLRTEPAASPVTFLTAIVWVVALSLLSPMIAKAAAWIATPILTFALRAPGHLAAANARTGARRLASVITPIGLLVALTVTILFVPATLGDAAARELTDGTLASHTLAGPQPGVPVAAAASVRAVPGVEAVTEVLNTTVRIGQDKYRAQAVTPENLGATTDLGITSGNVGAFNDTGIALSDLAAEQRGAVVGDTVDVTLGDGVHVELTVVATYSRHLGFGDLTLPFAVAAAHVDNPLPSSVLVAGTADATAIRAALAAFPAVGVLDRAQVGEVRAEAAQTNAEVQLIAMGLVIAFAAIAVVNTLAMATSDRAREFALLRLTGTTRRQVLRMLRAETGTAVVVAVLLGTAIALATLTAFAAGMTGRAEPSTPLATYAIVVAGAATLAFVATSLPARLALRRRPAETMGAGQ